MTKGIVQPLHDLLELLNRQFSTFVSVVGGKGLVECEFFGRENFVQFDEAFFDLELQVRRHLGQGKVLLQRL
jgi:hypothetical protein